MGIEVALAAAAVSSVVGGIMGMEEAGKQQDIAEENAKQARIAAQQSRVEAQERADIQKRETERLRSRQLVGFLKSGVQLEGTPLEVLEETERLGEEDVESILRGGEAQAQQFGAQSRNFETQGEIAQSQGRARLVGGIGSAIGSLGQGFGAGN